MSEVEHASSEQAKGSLTCKSGFLVQLDRRIAVEIHFLLGMIGVGGEKKRPEELPAQFLCIATVATRALEGCTQKVGMWQASRWAKFCSKGAQGQLASVKDMNLSIRS